MKLVGLSVCPVYIYTERKSQRLQGKEVLGVGSRRTAAAPTPNGVSKFNLEICAFLVHLNPAKTSLSRKTGGLQGKAI